LAGQCVLMKNTCLQAIVNTVHLVSLGIKVEVAEKCHLVLNGHIRTKYPSSDGVVQMVLTPLDTITTCLAVT